MSEPYVPKVDDYVKWERDIHGRTEVDEGWVYFYADEYITIETGIKPKPKCQYTVNERHKFIHTLLLCPNHQWHELKYIKSRGCKQLELDLGGD